MRIHRDLRCLLLLGIVCGAAASLSHAAPSDPDAADEKSVKIGEVWQASEVWLWPILRLAVSESNMDDATKRKAAEALLKYESQLRQMIADAQNDPSQADKVLEKLRTFQAQQNVTTQSLFNNEQWERIGKINSSIALQLTALSSDPHSFMAAIDKPLKLTADQKAKIEPSVARMAAKLESLKADLKRADVPGGPTQRLSSKDSTPRFRLPSTRVQKSARSSPPINSSDSIREFPMARRMRSKSPKRERTTKTPDEL